MYINIDGTVINVDAIQAFDSDNNIYLSGQKFSFNPSLDLYYILCQLLVIRNELVELPDIHKRMDNINKLSEYQTSKGPHPFLQLVDKTDEAIEADKKFQDMQMQFKFEDDESSQAKTGGSSTVQ